MLTEQQRLNNLSVPNYPIDVVLDTDAFNEIDDQFAISYLLKNQQKLCVKGFCAAPFLNEKSVSAADGMEKSYQEILKLLALAGEERFNSLVFRGSEEYLPDEQTPVDSDAALFMAELSKGYTPEKPLYVVAIGAITNVASALLMEPDMKDRVVIVWLGGNGWHMKDNYEFNLRQDVAAARVVFGCGAPVVQLPCAGVVDHFTVSRYELEHWLCGKNALCDYLAQNTIREAESYAAGKPWTRVIWDVTAIGWLLNEGGRFMETQLLPSPIPQYDHRYSFDPTRHRIGVVTAIRRDALLENLIASLT